MERALEFRPPVRSRYTSPVPHPAPMPGARPFRSQQGRSEPPRSWRRRDHIPPFPKTAGRRIGGRCADGSMEPAGPEAPARDRDGRRPGHASVPGTDRLEAGPTTLANGGRTWTRRDGGLRVTSAEGWRSACCARLLHCRSPPGRHSRGRASARRGPPRPGSAIRRGVSNSVHGSRLPGDAPGEGARAELGDRRYPGASDTASHGEGRGGRPGCFRTGRDPCFRVKRRTWYTRSRLMRCRGAIPGTPSPR